MGRAAPELLRTERYSFCYDYPTRYSDLDIYRHINNVAFAEAFEDARVRFAIDAGIRAAQGKYNPMFANANCDFLAEAHYPDPLVIYVAVLSIGRTSWTLAEVAIQNGKPCALLRGTTVLTDQGKPILLPDALRELLQRNAIRPVADV